MSAYIQDWTLLEELFGDGDLEELLETSWKRFACLGVQSGILEVREGCFHRRVCEGECLRGDGRGRRFGEDDRWFGRWRRSGGGDASSSALWCL